MWSHPNATHLTRCSVLFSSPVSESSIIWNKAAEDQAKPKTHLTREESTVFWNSCLSHLSKPLFMWRSNSSTLSSFRTHCCKSDWVWSDGTQLKKQSDVTNQWRADVNDFVFVLYLKDFMWWSSPDDWRRIFDHLISSLPLARVPSMDFYWLPHEPWATLLDKNTRLQTNQSDGTVLLQLRQIDSKGFLSRLISPCFKIHEGLSVRTCQWLKISWPKVLFYLFSLPNILI